MRTPFKCFLWIASILVILVFILTTLLAFHRLTPAFSGKASLLSLMNASDAFAQPGAAAQIQSTKDGSIMMLIPEGPFEYGVDQNALKRLLRTELKKPWLELYETEMSKETITLPNYYIDKYEVTNGQYERFCKDTGHRPSRLARWPQFNDARQPVVGIGWADAEGYCAWAGKRLPTEAEWEKAARGVDGRHWPWKEPPDEKRFNGRSQAKYASVRVGSFPLSDSPYGVSDMAGNVWEMTSGCWPSQANRQHKTMRGGSFLNSLAEVRTTVRWATKQEENGAEYLGFRCVMDMRNVEKYTVTVAPGKDMNRQTQQPLPNQ